MKLKLARARFKDREELLDILGPDACSCFIASVTRHAGEEYMIDLSNFRSEQVECRVCHEAIGTLSGFRITDGPGSGHYVPAKFIDIDEGSPYDAELPATVHQHGRCA